MNIFLSWSKPKSKEIAFEMKTFLEGLFRNQVTIWMSTESISFGSMSMLDINRALKSSDICIALITEENVTAPWIMYETGAIASNNFSEKSGKSKDAVIPIVFDNVNANTFNGHPLNQFQRLTFKRDTMLKLIVQLNDRINAFSNEQTLKTQFTLNWSMLNRNVKSIIRKYSLKAKHCVTCDFLVEAFDKENFPAPDRGNIIKYDSGFETQKLYEILLRLADKRLYVFGRKNRKLFSTENRSYFEDLNRRIENGFDFKCMFIDPSYTGIKKAQKGDNFSKKLITCLCEAEEVLTNNDVDPQNVCKLYSCERTEHIIIIDNVVLYSPITYSNDEYPHPLTKAPFYILDIDNPIGQKYYKHFEDVWTNSKTFSAPKSQ